MTGSPLAETAAPSPNHDARASGPGATMLILHYTGMPSAADALERLVDPASRVSAHYLVDEDGRITGLVPEHRRAWHAGVSSWRGMTDINSASIGIEIVNPGHDLGYRPFPGVQVEAVAALCSDILARHAIPARHVLGHSDVAPARKLDPGELFDWHLLAERGVGLWPGPARMPGGPCRPGDAGADVVRLQAALAAFGYAVEADGRFGTGTVQAVRAFQRHFRAEQVDGVADDDTRGRLAGVLALCGEDPGALRSARAPG